MDDYAITEKGKSHLKLLPDEIVANMFEAKNGFITIEMFWKRFADFFGYDDVSEIEHANTEELKTFGDLNLREMVVLISVFFASRGNRIGSGSLE